MRSIFSSILCLCLTCFFSILSAQQIDCDFIDPICSNESVDAGSPTTNEGGTVQTSCQTLQSNYTHWYYLRIQSGTTFTFTISPDSPLDYDFAVWLNPADCNNLGIADRGSFAAGGGATGLSCSANDTCEDAGGDRWVKYLDVQPGDLIVIAIDRWGSGSVPYTLSFGDCGGSGDDTELDCSILGDNYGQCDVDGNGQEDFDLNAITADITAGQPTWTVDYYEVENDALVGNANTESSPYTAFFANNPTELFARVEQNGIFLRIVRIFLYVNKLPQIVSPVDLTLCDLGNDGTEEFDLTLAESSIAPGLNNFNFKYYTTSLDANAGGNNNINPATAYNSGAGTVYVRVETGPLDGNDIGCYVVGEINLILTQGVDSEFNLIDEYCLDSTPPAFPLISDNGISGTWSPAMIDTSVLGTSTYTFTPDSDECALEYEIEVTIVEGILPLFDLEATFCQGTTADVLPLTSDNGIAGTWSPAVIDTSVVGTSTYTFIPNDPDCTLEYELVVEINNGVTLINDIQIELCDNNFDDTFEYDLTLLNGDLINPTTGITFSYFASVVDYNNNTPIPTTQWNNYAMTLPATILVVAENTDGCRSEYVEVDFIEGQAISLLGGPYEIPFCEGETVDLTLFQNIYSSETGVTYAYYPDLNSAQNETGQINTITNYPPTGIGATIFVRIEKSDGSLCPEIAEVEFIEGQAIALLSGPFEIPFCEGGMVDLTEFDNIYTSETGVTYTYYPTLTAAENETGSISAITNYPPSGIGATIFVRIEKTDGSLCDEIAEIEFIAGDEVQHNAGPFNAIKYCADESVDITTFSGTMANESGVTLSYYETLANAQNGTNDIPDETDYTPQGDGIIYVKLEKADRCSVILELPFEQLPAPEILNVPSQLVICEGQETIELVAESDDPDATFEWSWGTNQTSSGATITISDTGTYLLTVIGSNGCRNTQEIDVRPGGEPLITSIESGDNYLVVFAQPGNDGTLEYSLNGVLWQTSPRFDGLVKGQTYTVYVREDGCLVKTHTTVILDVPNFVSPNGDGYNDLWTIRGIEATPSATIKIFDRYGKIFVDTNFDGNYVWNGKYGGRPIPSGDYWYILEVPSDGVTIPKKFVGNISVRN